MNQGTFNQQLQVSFITVVFYQAPQALHEIEQYIKSTLHQIAVVDKSKEEECIKIYLKNGEMLICLTAEIDFETLLEDLLNQQDVKYSKTLFFGRFRSDKLNQISQFIEKYETRDKR